MYEYTCYTKQGKWKFYADSDLDAARLALFYSWRDGEDFIKVESPSGASRYTIHICVVDDRNHSIQTL